MSDIQHLLEDISVQNQMLHEALLCLDLAQTIHQFLGLHHLRLPTDSLAVYFKNNKLIILLASGTYLSRIKPLLGDLEIYILKNKVFHDYFFSKTPISLEKTNCSFINIKIQPFLNKELPPQPQKKEFILKNKITQSNKEAIAALAIQIKNPKLQQVLLKISMKKAPPPH